MCSSADTVIYSFNTGYRYSSYNSASGEDSLTRLLRDIVDAPRYSLILIEEIEIGLHPKMQRRLMDVLYHEVYENRKQFIVTTHSSTILSSVESISRIFINNSGNHFRSIEKISINAALSHMDAFGYPLVNIYVEDEISKKMAAKAVSAITATERGFNHLVHLIESGPANKTYNYFVVNKELYNKTKMRTGYACILDGDMRTKTDRDGNLCYPQEDLLFFHHSNEAPERMLVRKYLQSHPDSNLQYQCNEGNCHQLFKKMVELGLCQSQEEAFELCWAELLNTTDGQEYFLELQSFIKKACSFFSPNL